jgi:16S rRNA (cytosine1402-N4)-methyltransferase
VEPERAAHVPVLVEEVRALVRPERGGVFVDGTVGLGGHARMLLEAGADRVIGIDRDESALALAGDALAPFGSRVSLRHGDYRRLDAALDDLGIGFVNGVLLDLGVSSLQLDARGRGFSFRRDEPLDMRMDRSRGETAAERLATVDESTLADVIYRFGEERKARRVARAIVRAREEEAIAGTGRLASIVRRAVGGPWSRIDPATRTFQAVRIWVNAELEGLDAAIEGAVHRLAIGDGTAGGRLAVISFHSLEDRIVKQTLRSLGQGPAPSVRILTKRPVVASEAEVAANPRARSAKLRGAERVGSPGDANGVDA